MHELPVTQSIQKIALEHAGKANSKRITDLHVVTGELSSMVDDSIQFYWDIIAKDTIAEGATLHFRRVAVEMQCRSCSETFHPDGEKFFCSKCGSLNVKVTAGEEFFEVVEEPKGRVLFKTAIGNTRVVDMLAGEMLPRIC